MRFAVARVVGLGVVPWLAGCESATSPVELPGSIEASAAAPGGTRPGEAITARFLVRGRNGQPLPEVRVTLEVLAGGGHTDRTNAVTGQDGIAATQWVLGPLPGQQQLRAIVNPLLQSILSVTAQSGRAARLVPLTGSAGGLRGNVVDSLPAVRVVDDRGLPVADEPVTFTPASGSGSVAGTVAFTDSMGVARPRAWRLGPAAGVQTLTATVGSLSMEFTVTAKEPPANRMHIAIRFLTPRSDAESVAVFQAKARWESLIHSDLPDLAVSGPAEPSLECGVAAGDRIDDVLVGVRFLEASDDPFDGLLGEASLCLVRDESGMPAAGTVTLYRERIQAGRFELGDVILHEIGHVLGFNRGMAFLGERSRQAYLLAGGTVPPACGSGNAGPLCRGYPPQDDGGNHWSEAVFGIELMTPIGLAGFEPLSAVTLAALGDLGYVADEAGADPFLLVPARAPRLDAALARFQDRVLHRPRARIRQDGRILW